MKERYLTLFAAVYNIEPYLDRLFECVKNQTFEDYEFLILDDGSNDNTLEICEKYAEKDDRIRVISLPHRGLAATREVTFKEIKTKFAVCIDGDDWVEPDYLKHLVDAQKKYDADLVLSNVILHNEDGKEFYRLRKREEGFYTKEEYPKILPELLLEDRLNYLYTRIYKSELLKDIKVGDEDMGEDTRTVTQYILKTNNLAVIEDYDYHYIKYNSRSITGEIGDRRFEKLEELNTYVNDLMDQNGLLNDEMKKAIDTRILVTGKMALDAIVYNDSSIPDKFKEADALVNSEEYVKNYRRQKELGNINKLEIKPVAPGKGAKYIKRALRKIKFRVARYRIKQMLTKPFKKKED